MFALRSMVVACSLAACCAQTSPNASEISAHSTLCAAMPTICDRFGSARRTLFGNGVFEARGPKDLLAIISAMLATILGAMLVKMNVLIVLSLLSVGIGKLLLLILTVKSKLFQEHAQPPIVYERIYYPDHPHTFVNDHGYGQSSPYESYRGYDKTT